MRPLIPVISEGLIVDRFFIFKEDNFFKTLSLFDKYP